MTRDIFGRIEPDPSNRLGDVRSLLTADERELMQADLAKIAERRRRAEWASYWMMVG